MVSRVLIMEEEEPKSERKAWRKDNGQIRNNVEKKRVKQGRGMIM